MNGLGASQLGLEDQSLFDVSITAPAKQDASRTVQIQSPGKTLKTTKENGPMTSSLAGGDTRSAGLGQEDNKSNNTDARDEVSALGVGPVLPTSPVLKPSSSQQSKPLSSDHGDGNIESPEADTCLDEVRSPSEGSSPIRPMVRKSSLNFASLPAREPLAAGKAARVSRISHLDQNRTSYYSRPTGGKSLGHTWRDVQQDDEDREDMDLDDAPEPLSNNEKTNPALNHNKTYTQRLQDQINMLGKSQATNTKSSKSIPGITVAQTASASFQPMEATKSPSPKKFEKVQTTPGAFPEDDDDWIESPAAAEPAERHDPRPALPKSYSADVMEGIHGVDTIGDIGKESAVDTLGSPLQPAPVLHSSGWLGHGKSASVSALAQVDDLTQPLTKAVTVSNPTMASSEKFGSPKTPSKSPFRGARESPLKQVKNKLSSILKSSKGLLASSAAISAEGKSSVLSPSTTRLGLHFAPSSMSVIAKPSLESLRSKMEGKSTERDDSPTRPIARRTRASAEREKEERRLEKEAKRQQSQLEKLEQAREKEREKARVFSKEQARVAAMEQKVETKKGEEKVLTKEQPKPTRTSPRKAKDTQPNVPTLPDHDVEMTDATMMPPPSVPRSAGPSQAARTKDIKRPVKPTKEMVTRKQVPTVIRVNTGSQHSQYRPSTANTLVSGHDSISSSSSQSQPQLPSKASKATLQTKSSLQSLKNAPSTARPKALEQAAKKKEQDDREAQRRRDAKAEAERKRAAAQEDQRKQEQRRLDAERQKQQDREASAPPDAKKSAQRQALIEKAKQTRAPPPAARPHPNGPPDFGDVSQEKSGSSLQRVEGQGTRPPSAMNAEETNRPVSNASKAGVKRGPEVTDDTQAKRPPSRGGPSYQAKDGKRRRTSEIQDDTEVDAQPNIKNPPVRPSGGFKKVSHPQSRPGLSKKLTSFQELPKKSVFQNGYSNAPPSATRDLFKATVAGQYGNQAKAAHPLDMAQISKGAIPFAPNPNPSAQSHKTPARPGAAHGVKSAAKSVPRSSPAFQNGESIELPEIQTDDEDDEDEAGGTVSVAAWADSPDLRRALMRQETMDPSHIFGPPAPLNMEEVFSKSKDRFHKFRARTSSANWSGADRLTEDDIRKDLAARDKMRREGGWTYEMSRDMM
jgi:hypothetical protein